MKKNLITLIATAIVFATAAVSSVRAQNAGTVSVSVPFEFAAGNTSMPAGDYYVRRTIERAQVALEIHSQDNSRDAHLTMRPIHGTAIQNESKLVFNKYGDQYFLSQLWIAGRSDGNELAKTAHERQLRTELARKEGKPQTITVMARAK